MLPILRPSTMVGVIVWIALGFSSSALASVWQWSVPDGSARDYLWIPEDCTQVRGVVFANHNMIEQGILEHPTFRKTLADLGFAEVWAVPGLDISFDFHKGAGEHFQKVMDALAVESGYQELASAPVVPLGHSAYATFPWNFAAWNPNRTLCVLSVKGDAPRTNLTGYGRPNVDWGDRNIDGVPGLMVMSEQEWWEDRLTPALSFMAKHPATPIALLCDAGHGHFDYSDRLVEFLGMFIRKSAAARLPARQGTNGRPITLRMVNPKDGWRIDRWHKDQMPTAPAAPYADYSGDPSQAFWCFDREMADAIEAYYSAARGKKPQLIGIVAGGKTYVGEPVEPPFEPEDDGITFHLSAKFLDTVAGPGKAAKWSGLPDGSPLGHATDGGPIIISRIVGPVARLAPDTFALRFGRAEFTENRRNLDMWLVATHPGDDQYKSIAQQCRIHAQPNRHGMTQQIDFPQIGDQKAGVRFVALTAHSSAGLPVQYYVRDGPAEVDGSRLIFTPIPPRSKFPVKVTVVAWQWGRSTEPKVQTAMPVLRQFNLLSP